MSIGVKTALVCGYSLRSSISSLGQAAAPRVLSRPMESRLDEIAFFADRELARRLEAAEVAGAVEFARAYARLYPESGAYSETIAGGAAVYTGVGSPITQALGLGMQGRVEAAEVDRLEEFYRSRGSGVFVEHCPHADTSLLGLFGDRGYRLIEQTNMLARPIIPPAQAAGAEAAVTVRPPAPGEVEPLARVVAQGFSPEAGADPPLVDHFITFCHQANAVCLLAEIEGRIAGGGAAARHEGVAALFGTSTLPEYRGRGAQTALIRARLEWAAAAGCDLAMVSAAPGSVSHRNLERQGFRVAYTRAKLAHG